MKKAQITIYILLGIVILFGVTLVLFIRSQVAVSPEKEKTQQLPEEFLPVQTYVESCISSILANGLKRIGETGGYIDLDKYGVTSNQYDATSDNAFRFNPYDPNTAISYWWYFKSQNSCANGCSCDSKKPSLDNIQAQLNDYIASEFPSCLNNFEAFKKQNIDITSAGNPNVQVTIGESDVSAYVEYPLKLKTQGSEIDAKKFYVSIPLKFKRIYNFAQAITDTEAKNPYIEQWTLEQINGFGLMLNQNNLPPTSSSDLDPRTNPVYWSKQKIQDMFTKMVLVGYTPLLQVYGTLNYNDRVNTYYDKTTIPVISPNGDTYYDLLVDFSYLDWWPIYFDITGRGVKGDMLGPETGGVSDFSSILGMKRYNFYYDVSYPVLVEIRDKDSQLEPYFNKGYIFRFGLEANVRNNKPMNCTESPEAITAPPSGTQLCNAGCADVIIQTANAKDSSSLEQVNLEYGTSAEMCTLGTTRVNTDDGKTELTVSLPQCVGTGCFLKASRHGYLGTTKRYSVRCDTTSASVCAQDGVLCNGDTMQLALEPYRTKNITLKKWRMVKQNDNWILRTDAPAPLLRSEMALISLSRIKENEAEDDVTLSTVYYGNQSSVELSRLVPGKYTVTINLFYELPDDFGRKEIVFKSKQICTPGAFGIGQSCTTLGPYVVNESFPVGGSTFNLTLTQHDLDSYNHIILYAISSPDASTFDTLTMDDMDKTAKVEEYSDQYKAYLEPDFEIQ